MGLKKNALSELTPQVAVPKKDKQSLKKYANALLKKQDSKVSSGKPRLSLAEVRLYLDQSCIM